MFIWLEIWIRVLLSIFWYQEISEFFPIKLAKLVKCATFSQFFVPKKSLVSMLTWRCPGTWVVARWSHLNRTCKVQDIQGFLKVCGKEVMKRKRKKVHRNYSDYLIWFIILWRGRGPNGDNNAWTAFSWAALTRVTESLDLQQPYSHLMTFCTSWLHLVGLLRSPLAFLRHTMENGVDCQ
jgi:hypothetical protein